MASSSESKIIDSLQLKGERVLLRPVRHSDLKIIHKLNKNPIVARYNTLDIPSSIDVTRDLINHLIFEWKRDEISKYTFVIVNSENDEVIGMHGLFLGDPKYRSGEIWYKLFPIYWGKGYATESARLVIDFGFNELNLHRIEAGCATENKASRRVLEKLGMTHEGKKRKALPLRQGWRDSEEYGILSGESLLH